MAWERSILVTGVGSILVVGEIQYWWQGWDPLLVAGLGSNDGGEGGIHISGRGGIHIGGKRDSIFVAGVGSVLVLT